MRGERNLRNLFDEYSVASELEQHEKISSIGAQICVELVELLDKDLDKSEDLDEEDSRRIIVKNICDQLRFRAELALAYRDVSNFVRIWVSLE